MNDLIQHYERELALLQRSMATFATRYPKAAARLGIAADRCDDPHVERLLQSFALVAAGISSRIEDDYPELDFFWLDTEESEGEVFWLTADKFKR